MKTKHLYKAVFSSLILLLFLLQACEKDENFESTILSTLPANQITSVSAESGGNILEDNGAPFTDRGVVWSTSNNPDLDNCEGITNDGEGTGKFTSQLNDLSPSTKYYVRAYATSGNGTIYGEEIGFTTKNEPPVYTVEGFYKDIFMDGGINLTSRTNLPAAEHLGLSIEYFASPDDYGAQNQLFIGSKDDLNGVLLYPDGQPRFRMIYVNGGRATAHGKSLGEKGRNRINQYFSKGGSYVGTCAGAFLSSAGTQNDSELPRDGYLSLWNGRAHTTGLSDSYTGMFIEENSPLLMYYDFGGDMYIDDVRHNGGCFAYQDEEYPEGTEVLLRYDYTEGNSTYLIHNEISTWAYKSSTSSGRLVNIGSHPEGVTSGERRDLMAALILYAIDGNGDPVLKGELHNNEVREMTKSTDENDPPYTMIGDRQYHHFKANIPGGAENISVTLEGADGFDLNLYMNKDDFAFRSVADHMNLDKDSDKQLNFNSLEEGEWFIAVECYTTVETAKTEWGFDYTGKTDVLNGVPYSIVVKWE